MSNNDLLDQLKTAAMQRARVGGVPPSTHTLYDAMGESYFKLIQDALETATHESDRTLTEYIVKGLTYDSESDFFIFNPTFIETMLGAVGIKKTLQELKEERKRG